MHWWLPSSVLAAFAFFWFGLRPTVWVIASTTLRQTVTPSDLLGKVNGVFLTVNMGARPLGLRWVDLLAANGLKRPAWCFRWFCFWFSWPSFFIHLSVNWKVFLLKRQQNQKKVR